MFTLKMFRRNGEQIITKIVAAHHVQSMTIGGHTLEIWVNKSEAPSDRDVFYIGEKEPGMDALNDENHFGWALLENEHGRTTEHFRPAAYG